MYFIILYVIAIIFIYIKLKLPTKLKTIGAAITIIFAIGWITFISIKSSIEMPVVKEITKTYKVENGFTEDKEFVLFYTQTKLVVYQKHGEYYRKIYYSWNSSTFDIDKDLYLVYNRIEKQKISNLFFFFPFQDVKEFCGLTQ